MAAQPATVTRLTAVKARASRPSGPTPAQLRAAKLRRWSGIAALSVGALLTSASLSHLAHGIEATAHNGAVDARIMAVGIDLGFLTAEGACLCASGPSAATVLRWGKPMVVTLLALSTAMNAMAAASGATTTAGMVGSALIGMALPLIVYGCTRIAFAQLAARA